MTEKAKSWPTWLPQTAVVVATVFMLTTIPSEVSALRSEVNQLRQETEELSEVHDEIEQLRETQEDIIEAIAAALRVENRRAVHERKNQD